MQTLSEQKIIAAIAAREIFEATLEDDSLLIRVNEYVPYVCTAVHAGQKLRKDLTERCLLTPKERLREEDPFTDQLIDSFPIVIIGRDSRYEYDLNRDPEACIYDTAWEKKVWKRALTNSQKRTSRAKHASYYRILTALINTLEKSFGGCLLFDVHSYNWQIRQHPQAPVFNIGTAHIDVSRWRLPLAVLEKNLAMIELPNLETQVERNALFEGRGYQASFLRENFTNTLVIPIDIKKIFMDEENGEPFPLVLEQLQHGLHLALLETAAAFNKKLKRSKLKRADLQTSHIEPIVLSVDKALYRLAKTIETLHYVNPVNIQQEKRRFLSRKAYTPEFRYRQLRLDPYDFREKLYRLPVSQIQDPLMRGLYRSVVDNYATKVELLANLGTPQFLYNSLRYYGEPTVTDKANARFILHASDWQAEQNSNNSVDAEAAKVIFEQAAEDYGLDCRVILSTRIVAKAMVDNTRRALLINRNARLTPLEIQALINHELGVHMATTMNALTQPLHVFKLGLPGNTYTQEGLAILSEYLSGNMNLDRLKQLSLRVLAVNMMIDGMDFHTVFTRLREEHGIAVDDAFSLTTRVFRGGGFTKDYLYLSGFRDLVALHRSKDISALLVGKTGLQFIDTLDSMIQRGTLQRPKHISPVLVSQLSKQDPVLDYLVASIQ